MFKSDKLSNTLITLNLLRSVSMMRMYSNNSSSSHGSKLSSFIMSVNESDSIHSKLREFHKTPNSKITFNEWTSIFKQCRGAYPGLVSEIANTPVHNSIFHHLSHRAHLLEEGYFGRKTGESSVVLVGNSGIGKSTTYKNFVQSCQVFHPNVIPIYLTYENVVGNEKLKSSLPIDLIFAQLEQEHSINTLEKISSNDKLCELSTLLEMNNKRLMIIVDHAENIKGFPTVCDHLKWFSILSGDSSGRISVILSISSNSNQSLKSKKALSKKRFLEIKLPTMQPTNTTHVQKFLGCESDRANEITFFTGGNMREISRLLLKEELGISLTETNSFTESNLLDTGSEQLFTNITKKMLETNEEYFDSLCSDNRGFLARFFEFIPSKEHLKLDLKKVGKANLEEFTPLKRSAALKLWTGCFINKEANESMVKEKLNNLQNSGNILLIGDDIYPVSLWSLFKSR